MFARGCGVGRHAGAREPVHEVQPRTLRTVSDQEFGEIRVASEHRGLRERRAARERPSGIGPVLHQQLRPSDMVLGDCPVELVVKCAALAGSPVDPVAMVQAGEAQEIGVFPRDELVDVDLQLPPGEEAVAVRDVFPGTTGRVGQGGGLAAKGGEGDVGWGGEAWGWLWGLKSSAGADLARIPATALLPLARDSVHPPHQTYPTSHLLTRLSAKSHPKWRTNTDSRMRG